MAARRRARSSRAGRATTAPTAAPTAPAVVLDRAAGPAAVAADRVDAVRGGDSHCKNCHYVKRRAPCRPASLGTGCPGAQRGVSATNPAWRIAQLPGPAGRHARCNLVETGFRRHKNQALLSRGSSDPTPHPPGDLLEDALLTRLESSAGSGRHLQASESNGACRVGDEGNELRGLDRPGHAHHESRFQDTTAIIRTIDIHEPRPTYRGAVHHKSGRAQHATFV